jgi:hypothetical protein
VLDVWFTPDTDTQPYTYLGIANETVPECQGLGQTCRGNMWLPPSLSVCPVVKGDNQQRYVGCYLQVRDQARPRRLWLPLQQGVDASLKPACWGL